MIYLIRKPQAGNPHGSRMLAACSTRARARRSVLAARAEVMAWRRPALAVSRAYHSTLVRRQFLVLICLAALCACGYAKGRPYALEGNIFPGRLVSSLEKGMSVEEVNDILGEPLEKTYLDESSERWRYYALHRQDEEVTFLGRTVRRIPYYVVESDVILLFSDGLLKDIASRERTVNPGPEKF